MSISIGVFVGFGQSEVDEVEDVGAAAADEEVFRLDVSVDEPAAVEGLNALDLEVVGTLPSGTSPSKQLSE